MANDYQLQKLKQGVPTWNDWRSENRDAKIDLSHSDLSGSHLEGIMLNAADLTNVNFSNSYLEGAVLMGADLTNANLSDSHLQHAMVGGADFTNADLSRVILPRNLTGIKLRGAKLSGATFSHLDLSELDPSGCDFSGARFYRCSNLTEEFKHVNIRGAIFSRCLSPRHGDDFRGFNFSGVHFVECSLRQMDLTGANFSGAQISSSHLQRSNFTKADFSGAILSGTYLDGAMFIETNVNEASFQSCWVNNIIVKDLIGEVKLDYLVIGEPSGVSNLTIWDLQFAPMMSLLVNDKNFSKLIDTLTSKVILILGRFSSERKVILDAIRDELSKLGFMPVLFDFAKPKSKDTTGTVETFARLARFIIADITDPSSIPHELASIVPHLRTTPILPIKLQGTSSYSMIDDYQRSYKWVLDTYEYKDSRSLIENLSEVIKPAHELAKTFHRL